MFLLLWMDQKKGEPRDTERPQVMWDYWVQFNLAWIEFELNTLENISQGHIFRSCVPPLVHMLCNISMLYSVGRVIMAKPPRVYDDHSSEAPGGH